jgi:hypothetical protein
MQIIATGRVTYYVPEFVSTCHRIWYLIVQATSQPRTRGESEESGTSSTSWCAPVGEVLRPILSAIEYDTYKRGQFMRTGYISRNKCPGLGDRYLFTGWYGRLFFIVLAGLSGSGWYLQRES